MLLPGEVLAVQLKSCRTDPSDRTGSDGIQRVVMIFKIWSDRDGQTSFQRNFFMRVLHCMLVNQSSYIIIL